MSKESFEAAESVSVRLREWRRLNCCDLSKDTREVFYGIFCAVCIGSGT